jgi:toxin ParE1/3/4
MKYDLVIRPEAENDLTNTFAWYEDKRRGLGYEFLLQVDAGFNFILKNPDIHKIEYKGTRKHLIRRFPYKIIYLINKDKIIVIGVLHGKRNPLLTMKRIKAN